MSMKIFEKAAAFIFLLLLVGLIAFLTFVPLPPASEKVVLMIIGGLMVSATNALPKLFGDDNLKDRLQRLEVEHDLLRTKYDEVMRMLVDRHVVHGNGLNLRARIEDKTGE